MKKNKLSKLLRSISSISTTEQMQKSARTRKIKTVTLGHSGNPFQSRTETRAKVYSLGF